MSWSDEYFELVNNGKKKKKEEEDIAPVKETFATSPYSAMSRLEAGGHIKDKEKKKETEERTWFQSGAMDDDAPWYENVAKTILGTVQDVGEDIATGVIGIGEKIVDAALWAAPYISQGQYYQNGGGYNIQADSLFEQTIETAKKGNEELIKKDLYDEEKVAKKILSVSPTALALKGFGADTEEVSVLGEKSDSLVQSGGQLLATAGLQAVGVPWFVTSGATSFGSEVEGALGQGASMEEAGLSAAISAGAEILTEKISGGIKFGKMGTLDDALTKRFARSISNKFLRAGAKLGVDVVGEGSEEVLSGAISKFGQWLTYQDEKTLEELYLSEEAMDEAIESFIGGGVLGFAGGGVQAVKSTAKGVDYVSELTKNEQKVVDKVYKDLVAEAEKNGKITGKQKSKIYDDVLDQMEKGYITTDTIEEILGGKTYDDYKTAVESENAVLKELSEIYEGDELQQQVNDILHNSKRHEIQDQLSKEVSELVKGDRLLESYRQRAYRGQRFEANLTQYDAKQQETVKRAIESGVLNNTRRTHELVDIIAKISADKGVLFDFTNNEKLKESGFAVDGKTVNGFVTDSGVTLNVQSSKYLNSVVGHEITHVLEGTEVYDALQETLFEYAKSKKSSVSKFDNEYKERLYNTRLLYKNVKGYEGVEGFNKIKNEVVADLVGDYLFTDSDFIRNLSTENRSVFQKLWDEVKYLCKVATAGSKEARELEKVKKAFEDAYRAEYKADGKTKYSLTDKTTPSYEELIAKSSVQIVNVKGGIESGSYADMKTAVMNKATSEGWLDVPHHNTDTDSLIFLTEKSFSHAYSNLRSDFGEDTIRCMAHIPEIIKNAVLVSVDAPRDPTKQETKVYTFFGAVEGVGGIEPVKLTVKEYDFSTQDAVPKNIRSYFEKNGVMESYDSLYDAHALEVIGIESIKKESDASGKVYEQGSEAQATSDSKLNIADLLNLVKGDAKKYIPKKLYSLTDSDGKQLSKEQQEYFKDSKVRDENGNLKVMYHGTPNGDFTVFKAGTYFTDNKEYADRYQNPGASSISTGKTASNPKTFEVYLDIKKPFDINDAEARRIYIEDYIKGGNAMGINPYLSDAEYAKIKTIDWTEGEDLREFLIDNGYDYDGLVLDEGADGGYGDEVKSRGTSYVVFSPEQVKSVDNTKPTTDKDIRFSLSESVEETKDLSNVGETPKRYGTYNVSGEEVAYAPVAEKASVAPVAENATTQPVAISKKETTTEELFPDDLAPVQTELDKLNQQKAELESKMLEAVNDGKFDTFEQINAVYESVIARIKELDAEIAKDESARVNSLNDVDAPPVPEAPYYESNSAPVEDPFEDRNWEDVVGTHNRKVNAYMYEHPEVKPFFQEEARNLLGEWSDTQRGERIYNDQVYYDSGGEKGWMGVKRLTSQSMETMLDEWGMSYDEIENGLKAIIEDHGAENITAAKKIEFMLNDRLLNGYKNFYENGYIEPNQDYINLLEEMQINSYSKEAFDALLATADQYAPEDIAPVKETLKKATPDTMDAPIYESHEKGALKGQTSLFKDHTKPEKPATRKALHQSIVDNIRSHFAQRGFDFDAVLKKAKNLSTLATVDNTPQRVMEKALGYKEGGVLADLTVNKVAQNETEGIKWLNTFTDRKNGVLAQISKKYNIKPGSKESAAAQMYAEGFYVDENNEIIQYGDAELAQDFTDAKVRENIKGLARDPRIRRIYDETLAAINVSRARNLYPEIPRLNNYFLHFRAMEDTFSRLGLPFNPNDIKAKDLPTDLNGVTADLKPGQPYFASAMHRRGKRTSFDLLGGLEKYLTSAKNQIYHIDDIQTLRALRNYVADTYGQANGLEGLDALSEEEAQDRIEKVYNSHLSTFAKFLNEEANILAGKTALIDRGLEGIIGRRGITFLDSLNKQVGSNMVGYNISSSLTNFIPVAQTFAKTNKADFVKAFGQTVANKVGSIFGRSDGFTENSPVAIRRKGADSFYRTAWQKIGDPGYALMGAVDNISTELIARTKYNEFTRKGMDSQQAHYETDKWVSRLMGDRSLGQMPQLYNSRMLGLVTKFQLEVRNQLDSQFYDTIQEAKVSNEEIQNGLARNAKTAAKVASTFVQLAVVQHLFGKAFESVAGYNPAFDIIETMIKTLGWDDDEESEDTVLDNIEQGFLNLLEDLPYASTFLDGGRIPISSALPIEELIKGEDEYGNEKSRWETLGEVAPYYLMPGGYGQLKKTKQGLGMFSDEHPIAGSYTDSGGLRFPVEDTLGNRVQAGIFGQWANANARDYFDNERKPLNEKQIQEFLDVGLSIQDYWKYREGLSGLSKLAEKADYIDSLDLTDEQKNILINNIADRKEDIDMSDYSDYGSFEEFDFASKNPEKYSFLQENNVSYEEYKNFDDDAKDAYDWAFKNPEKFTLSKAVASDVVTYRKYTGELYDIRADKDENGDSISGSAKEKKIDYINNLDLEYGQKIILFKSLYEADDTYNYDIIEYLNGRQDISYEEMVTILKELGFTVSGNSVSWD